MKQLHRIYHFLRHQLSALHSGGHGIHSPYLFDFICNISAEKLPYYCFEEIEKYRSKLLNDNRAIVVTDHDTGSIQTTSIAAVASKALKPARYDQLLFRICERYNFRKVMELGTSLGITTLYLAGANKQIKCTTVEGCPALAQQAVKLHQSAGALNIELKTIHLDTQLRSLLQDKGMQDLIFIDANHRYEVLINYFNQCVNFIHTYSIIVVDDPYWSDETTRAWREIKQHERVTASIDHYYIGIIFFNPELAHRHYRVRL